MKFLGRARKFLQDLGTESTSKTQYFNVTCASGHRVRGERTEGYQALRCPACGEGVFVLPRSPLPEPAAPAGATAARRPYGRARSRWPDQGPIELTDPTEGTVEVDDGAAGSGEDRIIWEDEAAEFTPEPGGPASSGVAPEDLAAAEIDAARRREQPAPDGQGRRTRTRDARPAATRTGEQGGRPSRPAGGRPARVERAAPEAAGRDRQRRGPAVGAGPAPGVIEVRPRTRRGPRLGLIFLGLALAVGAALGLRAWRQRTAQYPLIAERGRTEGIPALEAGDFDRAYQLLSAARTAVEALGGNIEGADEIRIAAEEAAIFVNLCPETLENMLAEAGRIDPEAWESKFETHYKGQTYLFDSKLESTPATPRDEGGTGRYDIAYRVFPPGEATRFGDGGLPRPERFARIDFTGFELFESTSLSKDDRVTFGARLRSIAYDAESKQWVVRLEPRSGVFIQHYEALRTLGWPDPDTVEPPREETP